MTGNLANYFIIQVIIDFLAFCLIKSESGLEFRIGIL